MFSLSRKALGGSVRFVERSLFGGDSIGALCRAIWRPGCSCISALKRWNAVKRVLCIWVRHLPVFFNACVFCFRKEMKRSALTICLLWLYSVTCRNSKRGIQKIDRCFSISCWIHNLSTNMGVRFETTYVQKTGTDSSVEKIGNNQST